MGNVLGWVFGHFAIEQWFSRYGAAVPFFFLEAAELQAERALEKARKAKEMQESRLLGSSGRHGSNLQVYKHAFRA